MTDSAGNTAEERPEEHLLQRCVSARIRQHPAAVITEHSKHITRRE